MTAMTDEKSARAGESERGHHAIDDSPAPPRQRRMSAGRKQEAVLRVLRGEPLETAARKFAVTAGDLSSWRDNFLEAGTASMKSWPECVEAVEFRIVGAVRDALASRAKRVLANDFSADPAASKYQSAAKANLNAQLKIYDAFDTYANAVNLSLATRKRWLPALRSLARSSGQTNLSDITDDHVNAWIYELRRDGKAPRTIKDVYLASTNALFRYYVGERKLKTNPVEGFVFRVPKRRTTRGPGLTDDEVRLVLACSLARHSDRLAACHVDARRWIPWLALYSGARVNELTQLRKQDVREIDGVWCLSITPEAGSVKNYKVRTVPLHDDLITQGFLDFVTSCSRATLFYTASDKSSNALLTPYKKMGENLAKWIRELGVTDPDVAPNRGFRHRFKTIARRVGMDAEVRDALQGHAPRTEGEVYGEYPIEVLKRAIDKIPAWTEGVVARGDEQTRSDP